MQTIDAARRVIKTPDNCDDIPKMDKALSRLFSLELDYHELWNRWEETNTERKRLQGYWMDKWLCTDTHVGEMAYFLDDVLVFTCEQTARKSDAHIYFVDQEAYEKVKEFMNQFREPVEYEEPVFIGAQESRDVINFKYADSCLHRTGIYQEREVEIAHIPYNIRRDLNLPGSEDTMFYALFPYIYVKEGDTKTPVLIEEIDFFPFVNSN